MSEESTETVPPAKAKRPYKQRQPQIQAPIAPNPNVVALEGDYVQLVRQRQQFVSAVASAQTVANQAQMDLGKAQYDLQQIDSNIQFIAASIQQMKNGGMPVPSTPYVATQFQPPAGYPSQQYGFPPSAPYQPVTPFPTGAYVPGSFPSPNQGLYPDASPRGYMPDNPEDLANTASATDFMTPELRAQFRGGH